MEQGPLGLNPELRTPPLPATHVRAGTGHRVLARNYTTDQGRPSYLRVHSLRATSCRNILLEPTLQAVADRGLLLDTQTLHLDRGYDSALTTQRCQALGLTDIVCAKKKRKGEAKIKKPLTLGLRWPVEPVNSWFSNFGQLRRNTDRFSRQRLGQVALAIALILTVKLVKWAKRWTD